MSAESLNEFSAALSGSTALLTAGQTSNAGFMGEICAGTINLLPVKQRNAALSLNYRSKYGAIGTKLN